MKKYNLTLGVHLTKDPDIFNFEDDPLTYRGLMSCGHAVLPDSLSTYIFSLINIGVNEIKCPYQDFMNPLIKCGKIWPYKEIRKMALLTFEEKKIIEKKMNENSLRKMNNIYQCPQCQAFCSKSVEKSLKFSCRKCEILNKNCIFCCKCLRSWCLESNKCINKNCLEYRLEIEKILISSNKRIIRGKEVPLIRKCPFCEILIEFFSEIKSCKSVVCQCGKKFRMICLQFVDKNSQIPLCWDFNNNIDVLDQKKKCVLK